jgi:hypothetical protein
MTELFASEWTAVTIGELHLTASNLNKSIWRHSQIQTLHSDFKAKPSQSLRVLSTEAETICLPSGLKFTLETPDGKQIVSASVEDCLCLSG